MTDSKISAKQKIENAFVELLKEKPINEIKVAELIKRADVSKSTFYRNYFDVYDIYESVVTDFAQRCAVIVSDILEDRLKCKNIIDSLADNPEISQLMPIFKKDADIIEHSYIHNDPQVIARLFNSITDTFINNEIKRTNDENSVFYISFIVKGIVVSCINDYFLGKQINPRYVMFFAEYIEKLKNMENGIL